jgi:hypothetical protein
MPTDGPQNADDVRKVVDGRIAALGSGLSETVTIEWRGVQQPVPVISMPVDLLYYNPDTHRIRAQRSLDPVRDKELDQEPFGDAGQAYLHHLLKGDPSDPSKTDTAFDALMDDLKEHGQNDPGIITRSGVLINGNTRRAALKVLGGKHMRVGVLPPDAGHDDLLSVELSLQLRKDHRRDYSYMNVLLAIDERIKAGTSAQDIQNAFRIRPKTFEQHRWILAFVRDAMERSKVAGTSGDNVSMRLVDFEKDQGKMEELYRSYSALKAKSPDEAEALREQRLLALVLGKSKTDLRLIESDFTERYMKAVLPEPAATPAVGLKIPGTSITTEAPSRKVEALRALTDQALKARAVELAPGAVTPAAFTEATKLVSGMTAALEKSLEQAGKNDRITKKRFAPADRISDAGDDLTLAVAAIADARSTGNFDADDLSDALLELKASIQQVARLVARGLPVGDEAEAPSEGVAWLLAAANIPEQTS